jgi:putative hydrolase of the HAD superfamily
MKAVLFDLFGTLVPNLAPEVWTLSCEKIAGILGIDPEDYGRLWSERFEERMTGRIQDGPGQFDDILQQLNHPVDAGIRERAYQAHREMLARALQPKVDAIDTLNRILDRQLRLALVTDCSSAAPEILDTTPLGTYFSCRASSAHLGTRKPDPLMYQHVIEELQVEASDCLYVGDGNSHELPGAKKLGMTTVWVDNGEEQYWQERFEPAGDHTIQQLGELIPLLDRLE